MVNQFGKKKKKAKKTITPGLKLKAGRYKVAFTKIVRGKRVYKTPSVVKKEIKRKQAKLTITASLKKQAKAAGVSLTALGGRSKKTRKRHRYAKSAARIRAEIKRKRKGKGKKKKETRRRSTRKCKKHYRFGEKVLGLWDPANLAIGMDHRINDVYVHRVNGNPWVENKGLGNALATSMFLNRGHCFGFANDARTEGNLWLWLEKVNEYNSLRKVRESGGLKNINSIQQLKDLVDGVQVERLENEGVKGHDRKNADGVELAKGLSLKQVSRLRRAFDGPHKPLLQFGQKALSLQKRGVKTLPWLSALYPCAQDGAECEAPNTEYTIPQGVAPSFIQ